MCTGGVGQSSLGRSLRIASWATVAALLIAACGSGVQDGPPEPPGRVVVPSLYETTLATPIDPQTGIDTLDPGNATLFNFPRAVRENMLCLVDAVQVRCSDHAAVWRVEIDEPTKALLELPEKTEDRRDVIILNERDGRPEGVIPVSRIRRIDGWEVPFSTTGDPPPVITNPLGGCNWVLFMKNLEPRETFTPIRVRAPSDPVYMVISVCEDHPSSYEMTPLVVVNETTVAQIDAFRPFTARPGATYAWKIPDKLLNAATTIRGAIVRRQDPDGGIWVTHPLATNTNQ